MFYVYLTNYKTMIKPLFFNQLLIFLLLTGVFSCKKGETIKNSELQVIVPSKMPKDSNFVSIKMAVIAATQLNNSRLVNSKTTRRNIRGISTLETKQVMDTLAVPNDINPSYYIFNYVGGGFSIISADKRIQPILAYSNNGYFPHSGKLPGGLLNWLVVSHKNMQLVRGNPNWKIRAGVANLWTELNTEVKTRNHLIAVTQPPPPPTCQDTYTTTIVGPFLQTSWAQGYPYNLLCPAASNPATSYYPGLGRDPAGCVATAMAQVMYYWKSPARYNWSIMPLTSIYPGDNSGNMAVAQLVSDAGIATGMVYTDSDSETYDSNISRGSKNLIRV